jgi:hypothetical protein
MRTLNRAISSHSAGAELPQWSVMVGWRAMDFAVHPRMLPARTRFNLCLGSRVRPASLQNL